MTVKVELRPAFVWDCDSCGRENFETGIVAEMSDDDRREMRDQHGIDDCEDGEFMTMPERVTCRHCGTEFETEHYSDDEPKAGEA